MALSLVLRIEGKAQDCGIVTICYGRLVLVARFNPADKDGQRESGKGLQDTQDGKGGPVLGC